MMSIIGTECQFEGTYGDLTGTK